MCQYLEGLYNSENQYFPSELCMTLEKHSWAKNPYKIQDSQVDFNITEDKKFISGFRFHTVTNF